MDDKGCGRRVPRDQLTEGAEEIGVPLEEHVMKVVEGPTSVRTELGR